ncbi:MAG: FliH/SctL family protein [Rhodospirillaceae bacterium]|jgi:flagellar assembly protein FliH
MASTEKFLFDYDFDCPPVKEKELEEDLLDEDDESEPEIVVPTFSEEEMKAAREDSFARGKEEGVKETLESVVQQTATSLEAILEKIEGVFQRQDEANTATARDAVNVATSITRKLFPQFSERGALEEVERVIISIMEKMIDEPRLTITVNESLRERISSRLEPMMSETGFEGKVIFNGDEALPLSDCRIEWGTGTASRDTKALWQDIDSLIAENMSEEALSEEIASDDQTAQDANVQEDMTAPQTATDEDMAENRVQSEADSPEPESPSEPSPEIPEALDTPDAPAKEE